jgi:HAD superfamily hydrolase (TIGR01549 family)
MIDTVVLDVDGTLVDTVYHHVIAWDQAFSDVGVHIPLWRIHRAIGMGGDRLVAEVGGEQLEAEHGDRVRTLHDERFGRVLDDIHPLPGAADLMRTLRDRGLNVVIASSGEAEQTERLLTLVDGDELAHARTTSADVDSSKPAPDLIDAAIERVGGESAAVIGDAVWDMAAGRKGGHHCIGLLCGGFSEAELSKAGADQVFESPRDLLDALDRTPLAGPEESEKG